MPGLLKVGKTTRDVAERCRELTSATGVPTPFVVAFEQHFQDCDYAEREVHAALSASGYRQSENREFFRASPNEVVRIILSIPNISSAVTSADIRPEPRQEMWQEVYDAAWALVPGADKIFSDEDEAIRLFVLASKLGAPYGYQMAGQTAAFKSRPDVKASIEYFRLGVAGGDYYCFARLALLLEREGDAGRARLAWIEYFDRRAARVDDKFEGLLSFVECCVCYLEFCINSSTSPVIEAKLENDIALSREVYEEVWSRNLDSIAVGSKSSSEVWQRVLVWMERNPLRKECEWVAGLRSDITKEWNWLAGGINL